MEITVEGGSEPGALVVTARGRFATASVDVTPHPVESGWVTSRGGRYFDVSAAVEAAEREVAEFVRTLDAAMTRTPDEADEALGKAERDVRREREAAEYLRRRNQPAVEPPAVKPPKPSKRRRAVGQLPSWSERTRPRPPKAVR